MTPDIRGFGILSLKVKHDDNLLDVLKIIFSFEKGSSSRKLLTSWFFVRNDVVPKKGSTSMNSFFGTVVMGERFLCILLKKV